MSKLSKLFKGLKTANDVLSTLDQFIDIDRLIGISNAQGPQAKLVKAIMGLDPNDPELRFLLSRMDKDGHFDLSITPPSSKQKKLPSKKLKT